MIVKSVPEELIDRSRQFIGNNVKVVVGVILFAQKKIYYCRLENT